MLQSEIGIFMLGGFIRDDISIARMNGDTVHARHLERVLSGFEISHPGAHRVQGSVQIS